MPFVLCLQLLDVGVEFVHSALGHLALVLVVEAGHILKFDAWLEDGVMLLAGTLVLGVPIRCDLGHAQDLNTQGEGASRQAAAHLPRCWPFFGPGLLARCIGNPVLSEQVKVVLVSLLRVLEL